MIRGGLAKQPHRIRGRGNGQGNAISMTRVFWWRGHEAGSGDRGGEPGFEGAVLWRLACESGVMGRRPCDPGLAWWTTYSDAVSWAD